MTTLLGLVSVGTPTRPADMVTSTMPVANIQVLRNLALPKTVSFLDVASYYAAEGVPADGGGGTFQYIASDTTSPDDGGLIIVNLLNGARYYRVWDGQTCFAAWWGYFPGATDIGPLFGKVPFYATCWFQPGVYGVNTYPLQYQFSCKFWRGTSTIWKCTGTIGDGSSFSLAQVAFNWVWVPTASVANLQFASDMTQAGLSPIEGIGILSELGVNFGVGLALGWPIPAGPSNPGEGVRATTSHTSGQVQWEVLTATGPLCFCTSAFNLTTNPGTQSTGWALANNGSIYWNGGTLAAGLDGWLPGQWMTVRLDLTNQKIYTRNNTTNPTKWNNSNTANPDTNTGGISYAGETSPGTVLFAALLSNYGDTQTYNFGGSSFITPLSGSCVAYGASTTLNPADNVGITLSNGNLTGTYTGGTAPPPLTGADPINYLIRPKNFSIVGFYCGVAVVDPINYFLTGLENCYIKGNSIGYYYNQASAVNSTENLMFTDVDFDNNTVDGVQSTGSIKTSFRGCSFDYNVRNGYFSNNYTYFENSYLETEGAVTTAELFALDTAAILDFLPGTNFLSTGSASQGYTPGDLFNFESSTGIVYLRGNPFCDANTTRQFMETTAGNNIYGTLTGFNGRNFPICVSPNNLLQSDYLFASGTTFYPGSTCTFSGGFAVFTGAQTLNSQTMKCEPGDLIAVTLLDELTGTITGLNGGLTFSTADGTQIGSTENFSTSSGVANFVGANSSAWNTTARGETLQQFIFRAPPGASQFVSTMGTTGGSGQYKVTSFAIYKGGAQ